jgi:hypothetical protein
LKIGDKFEESFAFYYERSFALEDSRSRELAKKSFEDINESLRLILLADSAGSGKTTTFQRLTIKIKEKTPTAWVFYVDLKDHLGSYEKRRKKFYELDDFLVEILKLKNFDAILFRNFIEINKLVLLWDGVDEISPNYKDFMINLILRVQELKNVQQWVSTRPEPELKEELKRKLSCEAYELSKFVPDDFLRKYLNHVYDDSGSEKYRRTINSQLNETLSILDKMEKYKSFMSENLQLNNPLILVIVANMTMNHDDDDYAKCPVDVSNLYSIYTSIVCQKLTL